MAFINIDRESDRVNEGNRLDVFVTIPSK